jgi:cephalosporin-C deacetylase
MTGFDDYWAAVDAELAQTPSNATLEPLPRHSTDTSTTYLLRLDSLGGYRIAGYYCVPRAGGPLPALLATPRYGSVNHIPDFHDRERYAVLQLIHRGQRLADQPFAAAYPGLLTLDIDEPQSFIYRAIVADCLRGAEFLAGRAEVDTSRMAVQGDDLALLTAARRPVFSVVQASDLLLYRLLDLAARSSAYPAEEINDFVRANPERRAAVAETLTYFDPRAHAPAIQARTLVSAGDDPTWLEPLRLAFSSPYEEYQLTHRGAIDHDWLDAWLAQQLGAEPRQRFLARA